MSDTSAAPLSTAELLERIARARHDSHERLNYPKADARLSWEETSIEYQERQIGHAAEFLRDHPWLLALLPEEARPSPERTSSDATALYVGVSNVRWWTPFNLNDRFRVRLNEAGRRIWRDYYRQAPYSAAKCEGELTEVQAWEFARIFGPHLGVGFDNPCDMTVEILMPDRPARPGGSAPPPDFGPAPAMKIYGNILPPNAPPGLHLPPPQSDPAITIRGAMPSEPAPAPNVGIDVGVNVGVTAPALEPETAHIVKELRNAIDTAEWLNGPDDVTLTAEDATAIGDRLEAQAGRLSTLEAELAEMDAFLDLLDSPREINGRTFSTFERVTRRLTHLSCQFLKWQQQHCGAPLLNACEHTTSPATPERTAP